MSIRQRLKETLERIRNPEPDDAAFRQHLGWVRLLFFLPFLIAAIIFFLMSIK